MSRAEARDADGRRWEGKNEADNQPPTATGGPGPRQTSRPEGGYQLWGDTSPQQICGGGTCTPARRAAH